VFDVFTGASLGLADLTVRDGVAPPAQSGGAVRSGKLRGKPLAPGPYILVLTLPKAGAAPAAALTKAFRILR
jgi:hypothetical protein